MEDFLFIYRMDLANGSANMPAEQAKAMMQQWQDWLGTFAAKNKLVTAGNRLQAEGKIVKPGSMVTDGPYIEMKEAVGGYSIVKAESLAEATEMAKGCPIFFAGGNVEVRQIIAM